MKRLLALLGVLALILAACGGGDDAGDGDGGSNGTSTASAGDAARGESVFQTTCGACHGPDARGLEGLGKDLHNNQFVDERTDEEMVDFLNVGRGADDPLNTTGVAMPPKGGNPSLSDDDLLDVVAYLRTLD